MLKKLFNQAIEAEIFLSKKKDRTKLWVKKVWTATT